MDYSEVMAENGRKGGLAKAIKYKSLIIEAIKLFITKPKMTQQEIAEQLGVSQAFVSEHTKDPYIKKRRYDRLTKSITAELTNQELERILLKAKLEEKLLAHQEDINTIKNHKRSKI